MAAVQHLTPTPPPARPLSFNGSVNGMRMDGDKSSSVSSGRKIGSEPQRGDTRIVVIVYGPGQDKILSVFAEVLGKPFRIAPGFTSVTDAHHGLVVGVEADNAKLDIAERNRELVVAINAHCVNLGMPPDPSLSAQCDYEFLYTEAPFFRRDLTRFISFTLGQINHHEALMAKPRTYFISTTFPDVRAALPNIDILTVGADAVEIRVDLLQEPLGGGKYSDIPSLSYVGEQVMLLRQRTELPIIFTTRCTQENGRFPMENPELYYEYLYRAIQWGVEYIDVELWLPEDIRRRLWENKGSSHIMSAFHDFSGTFKWPSRHAEDIFAASMRYADIVKMIAIINDPNENFELEYFRSKVRAEFPAGPPLSAVNMGETGQFSRTLNKCFTPITHPLLPIIAAPGQMSAEEINSALSLLGQLPKKLIYGIGSPSSRISNPQAPFYEKCFNELGLPHQFAVVERHGKGPGSIEIWCNQKNFGGAYLNPPMSVASLVHHGTFFPSVNHGTGPMLTEAASIIGMADTIVVRPSSNPSSAMASAPASIPSSPTRSGDSPLSHYLGSPGIAGIQGGLPAGTQLILDNAAWRGILSTLTRDFAPSAYFGRSAVVLASSGDDAASVLYALKMLNVGKTYTVGFRTPAALASIVTVEPFNSLESLQRVRASSNVNLEDGPFLVVSALGSEKRNLVGMILRLFGGNRANRSHKRVFLDLADPGLKKNSAATVDPSVVAEQNGFAAYGVPDVAAFTTVETLRLLVGQNVPYSFVRLASPRGMY